MEVLASTPHSPTHLTPSCFNEGGAACEFHCVFNVQFQTAWDHKSSAAYFLKKHLPRNCQDSNGSGYYINHGEL